MKLCYDLTPEELTDGKLADLANQIGHPSLRVALNQYNWWDLSVEEVEQPFLDDLKNIESMSQ